MESVDNATPTSGGQKGHVNEGPYMMRGKLGVVLGAGWLVGAVALGATDRLNRVGLAELEAKVCTMYVVRQLRLTGTQKQELLRIRQELAPIAGEHLKRLQTWRKATRKAVPDYVEYSTRTGKFPPERIQKGLEAFDHPLLHMPRAFRLKAGPIADRFGDVLNTRQKAFLGKVSREKWRVVGADYLMEGWSREDETDGGLTKEQRKMALSTRLMKGTFTRAGHIAVAAYLEEALGSAQSDFPHWWDMDLAITRQKRVAVSHKLTFLLGLHLEAEQMVDIVKCLRRYLPRAGRVPAYGEDLATKEGRAYIKLLKKAGKTLGRGRPFPAEKMTKLQQARHLWLDTQGKAKQGPSAAAKRHSAGMRICAAVRKTLSESQATRLLVMELCAVPNASVKDTARAGQVAGSRAAEIGTILDAARQRDDWGSDPCEAWWDEQMVRLQGSPMWVAQMTPAEKAASRAEATRVVEKVRGMPAAEYVAKREELSKDLLKLDLAASSLLVARKKLAESGNVEELLREKIKVYFVYGGPVLLPLLEARLKHLGMGRTRR